jgi:rubrerythrin
MKLSELKQVIELYKSHTPEWKDEELVVVVKTSGSVGGTPSVKVKSLHSGFDWDSGKLMIYTEEPVMKVNQQTLDELRKEAEKIGWDMYENRNLKSENKKLKAMIKTLKDKYEPTV